MAFLKEAKEWAAKEGESEVVHHYTKTDVNSFMPFSHFGTHQAARERAASMEFDPGKSQVHSVRIKLGNTVHIPDLGGHYPEEIASGLREHGHITDEDHQHLKTKFATFNQQLEKPTRDDRSWLHPEQQAKASYLAHYLRNKKGIHTISYENDQEDEGSTSYMITHHSQVRKLRKSSSPKINIPRGWKDY